MTGSRSSGVLVIGVGNDCRGDDAAGWIAARRARRLLGARACVREEIGDGAALMEAWKDAGLVIVVDAVHSGAAPGTIHRFQAREQPIPSQLFHGSTHAFGVAEAVELARALNQLPPKLIIYGIEGKCFSAGQKLSPEVARAAATAAHCISWDVAQSVAPSSSAKGRGKGIVRRIARFPIPGLKPEPAKRVDQVQSNHRRRQSH